MDKVVYVENLLAYKEAVKRLGSNGIDFDKKKLLDNLELCYEVIRILDYYSDEE